MTETDWASILEPYARLIPVTVMGKAVRVPENNLYLRCFQYLEPERVPYGDFCWNAQCFNCRMTLRRAGAERPALACQTVAEEGDEVVEISPQLQEVLAGVLGR